MAHHKTKSGSRITITGVLRKLSHFSSASSMSNVERTEWYWDVISKAEYEARGQYNGELSVATFIDTIMSEIRILELKELKKLKEKEENNGK